MSTCVVYITTPAGPKGKKIAAELIKQRVGACVNIIPSVQSLYWWKGKVESAKESLLIVKTTKAKWPALMKLVRKIHPYAVPEIIALPIIAGSKPYLDWVKAETRSQ